MQASVEKITTHAHHHMACSERFLYPSIVAVAGVALWSCQAYSVKRARDKCGIHAPAVIGDEELERTLVNYQHTTEALPAIIPMTYVFSALICPKRALILGLGWVATRLAFSCSCICGGHKENNCFKNLHMVVGHVSHFGLLFGSAYGVLEAVLKRCDHLKKCC
ncbi:putative MAPEG family protein [Cavenderia fasciculata]|uniref:MAPEG family protein n=1 Tax=Cavenderia fasciculata TaxID=261658 RepID=F4PVF2_CACFS|nr:putative MAPEG family protein [Cavenderia fasciculata]EGG19966.1 putative MAPEG family protein [Cavenderia fasciculata]|eukprot:XP_004366949.1 putative MAPEG family protein [Cavenderia fasciculata]